MRLLEHPDGVEMTAHKAYAAAVVAVVLYLLHGWMTGEWVSVAALGPALTIIVTPLVVWAIPNRLLHHDG